MNMLIMAVIFGLRDARSRPVVFSTGCRICAFGMEGGAFPDPFGRYREKDRTLLQ